MRSFELIAQLIEISLDALYDKGVIDISDDTEEFRAECKMELDLSQPHGVTVVSMCGWYVFIWWMYYADGTKSLEAYHAQSIAIAECQGCTAPYPESELRDFHGRKLCDTCRWVGLPQKARTA